MIAHHQNGAALASASNQEQSCSLLDLLFDTGLSSSSSCSAQQGHAAAGADPPFTLRLDHRVGAASAIMQKHPGEERLLIFRSDRPGAIAKIIYSSQLSSRKKNSISCTAEGCSSQQDDDGEEEDVSVVEAKIHVLECKEAYRGHDLGGLLFTAALNSLRRTYSSKSANNKTPAGDQENRKRPPPLARRIIHCQLEAEEDERRHNQLVGFYEELGCSIRDPSKIKFVCNNDGETYRKVNMFIDFLANNSADGDEQEDECTAGSIASRFLVVNLLQDNGKCVRVSQESSSSRRRRHHWLLQQDDCDDGSSHFLQLCTTRGSCLNVDGSGACSLIEHHHEPHHLPHSHHFQLFHVSDFDDSNSGAKDDKSKESNVHHHHSKAGLWTIRSVEYGTFLALHDDDTDDSASTLQCQVTPAFWQVVESSSITEGCSSSSKNLMCTTDTPARRQHYLRQWKIQCLEYVRRMKARYLTFDDDDCARMDLRTALMDQAQTLPADPFHHSCAGGISLRTLAFRSAECVRARGHPDWVQLVALVYYLGRVVDLVRNNKTLSEEEVGSDGTYDWTLASRSRVLGCPVPERVVFGEFQSLRPPDKNDSTPCCSNSINNNNKKDAPTTGMYEPHCGLENVELCWTGPEYMYHMLQHNGIAVPEEGLAMLRLASLSDWHSGHAYAALESQDDAEVRQFVAEFDNLLQTAAARKPSRMVVGTTEELSNEDCEMLWTSHYEDIALKYNVGDLLQW